MRAHARTHSLMHYLEIWFKCLILSIKVNDELKHIFPKKYFRLREVEGRGIDFQSNCIDRKEAEKEMVQSVAVWVVHQATSLREVILF